MTVGMKFDAEKARYDLLPWRAVHEVVRVLTFGAGKYGPNNWRKVKHARDRYFAAVHRHLQAWEVGERDDAESGLHHLAHAVTNILFLLTLELLPRGRKNAKLR